jgi:hypothetical protein
MLMAESNKRKHPYSSYAENSPDRLAILSNDPTNHGLWALNHSK